MERGLLGAKCWTSSGARFSIESSPHRFPPSLPFPPLLLHTLTSCDFGEKWRGRGGGFIFIIRNDGYRSIKLFPWKKKKTPMTPKGSCLETTRFHANSLIMRLVWPSSSKIFHFFFCFWFSSILLLVAFHSILLHYSFLRNFNQPCYTIFTVSYFFHFLFSPYFSVFFNFHSFLLFSFSNPIFYLYSISLHYMFNKISVNYSILHFFSIAKRAESI